MASMMSEKTKKNDDFSFFNDCKLNATMKMVSKKQLIIFQESIITKSYNMKKIGMLTWFCLMSAILFAQERKISGTLVDRDTKEGVVQATVQLLKPDSTFVTGTLSNDDGVFSLQAPSNGQFIMKVSSVGYKTLTRNLTVSGDKNQNLGQMTFEADAVMLKEAVVTGQAAKVTLRKDTCIYNAAAYRTPEGSVAEELVKKLPGAQVGDDGKITINGKEVKKILVDGKEFMTGDTQTAMKNLPTYIINNIRAYDQQSDLARVTGIDDGNEETVLDFGIKAGMNKGYFANADLGAGTKDRYSSRIMGSYQNSTTRITGMINANNTNDMGFPGGGGGGRFGGRNGLNSSKMTGLNFNYDNSKNLELDASLRWNHSDGDTWSRSATENFGSKQFSNSLSQNFSRSNNWNAQMRLEWRPDSMTNIMFRPSLRVTNSDSRRNPDDNISATFNQDPYLLVADPLASISELVADSIVVNTNRNGSLSNNSNTSANAMLQLNRRLSNNGRNVTLRGDFSYGDQESKSLSLSEVIYYKMQLASGNNTQYTNRYNLTPTKNWSYAIQTTYSEPIGLRTYLQFSYQYKYSYNKSDRSTYTYSPLGNIFNGIEPVYGGFDNYLSLISNPLGINSPYYDEDQSRFSEYKNYIHQFDVMFRKIRDDYQFNAGLMFQPQKSHFIQDYKGVHADTTRTVFNVSPTIDFRYRPNYTTELRINYRGTTQQPQMSDLLDITDDSNPLSITKGNPGLKPSFTNNLRVNYNTYIQDHMRSIMLFSNYSNTRNSISNLVQYIEETGGRITKPENINGDWNASLGFMFNTAIDSAGVWNVNTFTMINHTNSVGYLFDNDLKQSVKNTTKNSMIMERLQASYRKDWFEIALDGSVNYTHARNELQSQSDLDTWQFSYGGSINIFAPWGTSLSTDLHNQSRRGYNDNSMNTNELVWNAQISQSFLKGNALTVSLQFYDMLHQMSTYSRSVNAMQRTDSEYNSINSYAMLHVIYRFNAFGGRQARQMMRGMPGMMPGGMPPGGGRGMGGGRPMGGGFGGGFGGGRPGGFGGR